MRAVSNKDGDLLSQFDNINENDNPVLEILTDLPIQSRDTPRQKMLFNNHIDAKKGKKMISVFRRYLSILQNF